MNRPRATHGRWIDRALTIFASAILLSACLRPAAERAVRDEQVGHSDTDAGRVQVSAGLGVVRAFDAERLELWQSAPSIEFSIDLSEPGALDLVVNNTMPSSELEQSEGTPVEVEMLERSHPTRAEFVLRFDEAGPVRFRLIDPRAERVEPFRFALMSDVQEAIDRVADLYERINQEAGVEFCLGAGDLTQQGSRSQLSRFERELSHLLVPYYTTLGNHELGVRPPPYQETFGRANFSFVYRGVRFTLLDSASATIDPKVYGWLDRWLSDGRDQFHVVAMHVPPIDPVGLRNGSFASRNEANKVLVRLLEGEVDLTLYGHLHSYFRFENAGIPARVSGGGGAIPERFDRIGRHFLSIDVDPEPQRFETHLVQIEGD